MKEPEADALDRSIDAALRRHFTPPPSLDTLARRLRPGGGSRAPWLALLALAAVLLAVLLAWRALARAQATAPVPVAAGPGPGAPLEADPPACSLVGPLREGLPEAGHSQSPDLARLYRDMDACQRSASGVACGDEAGLAARLSAAYGEEIALRPEAAGLLHGPFGSREWPTGTIVTATSDDQTAVLVADRDSTLACCVRMLLAEDSGLHMFTWQVGGVVLTEITPFDEPRLLAYFE